MQTEKTTSINTYNFLKLTYLIRYLGDAFFYVYIFVYLGGLGFNTGQIGLISALMPLAALAGNFLFKRLAVDVNKNRILMLLLTLCEFAVALLFAFHESSSFYYYLFFITFVSIFNGPFYTLLDGYSGTYILKAKKQYSSMRIMGTLSYVIAPLLSALLMARNLVTYELLFYLSAGFFMLTFIFILLLPKSEIVKSDTLTEKFKLKEYPQIIIYLIFLFFVAASAQVSDNFFALYLSQNRGVSDSVFGYITSGTIFIEMLVFIFIIYKKNMFKNPTFSYLFMGLTMLGRPLSIALGLPDTLLYIFALFRGLAWGYYLVFNVLYIGRTVPVSRLTGALFTASIVVTIGRILQSLLLGELLKHHSYELVFSGVSLFIVFGIILTITLSYLLEKKRKEARYASSQSFNE